MQKRGQNRSFSLYNFSSKNHKGQRPTISSRRNRRGLSTVIVTLILILVSLVTVGIVWVVVRNVIQTGTEGVGLSQFSLSAKILDVSIDNSSNNVSLTLKRNAGKGELEGISFVFSSSNADTEVITRNVSLKELEQMNFNFHLINMNVSDLTSVSIVPLIKQDEKQITGIALDKYNFGNNKNNLPGQCTPLINNYCSTMGFVCGDWGNGSCGGNLNCGNCTGGQICNTNGICVSNCVPATCASSGYECGSGYANGTCGGTFNCESPTCVSRYGAGYTCNASGRCVASGNIINAASCSQTDVQNAINTASDGYTVIVPAGNCAWTSRVGDGSRCGDASVCINNKQITLQGAGIDQTVINDSTNDGWNKIALYVNDATKSFRITGFTFRGTNGLDAVIQVIKETNSNNPTIGWRIDHVKFNFSGSLTARPIQINGYNFGLIDNNIFTGGNYQTILVDGEENGETRSGDNSWSRPVLFGTANAVYIENNIFLMSNCLSDIDSNHGARVVFRYNNATNFFAETHGTGHAFDRAGLLHEFYNNTFRGNTCMNIGMALFGGTGVMFNNHFETPGYVYLGDYRTCCGVGISCNGIGEFAQRCDGTKLIDENQVGKYGYKCADQVGTIGNLTSQLSVPIYIWNNGINASISPGLNVCSNPGQLDHVQQGRDYYTCTDNSCIKPGYIPYTYPHPLST